MLGYAAGMSSSVVQSGDGARFRVPAVERTVLVLDALAGARDGLTFAELATRVPIARSSLHDLCSSLEAAGLVEKRRSGRYALGLKVVELARRRLDSTELVTAFREVFREIGAPRETIVLAVRSGADVVYLSYIDGNRPLAVKYEVGMRLPAAFTASGRAILATLPPASVIHLLPDTLANPNADGQVTAREDLLAELEVTRQRGYSIDDEETAAGMTCIGAPVVLGAGQEAVGAVAVSLVKSTQDWFDEETRDYVRQVAASIARRMGSA